MDNSNKDTNNKTSSNNSLSIEVQHRRSKVAKMYLDGITNQTELANAFGVSQATIHRDLVCLRKRWTKEQCKSIPKLRSTSIKHLYSVAERAMQSYKRSRRDAEEITTSIRQDNCPRCRGLGTVKKEECDNCNGSGQVSVEVVTKKIKGNAGDVAFLGEFRKCIQEINKLQGLYVEKRGRPTKERVIDSRVVSTNNDYENASPDKILEAMQAIKRLESDSGSTVNESKEEIVDVEPESK